MATRVARADLYLIRRTLDNEINKLLSSAHELRDEEDELAVPKMFSVANLKGTRDEA
jgi:hypothetical protein